MCVELPDWLNELRKVEITNRVREDPRSRGGTYLSVDRNTVFSEVAGGGQADFDTPWPEPPAVPRLSAADRVLLYAYFMQKGHLEELTEAFGQLLSNKSEIFNTDFDRSPVIIDLGCGPFTGALALAGVLEHGCRFDYIGVDRAQAMRELGKRLASSELFPCKVRRQWVADLASVCWSGASGWRPVIVIVSYLLASPTLDVTKLVGELDKLLEKIGHGPVTVLYTNSTRAAANQQFPAFSKALQEVGFRLFADDAGCIEIARHGYTKARRLRYALFHRSIQNKLSLQGG